MSLNVATILNGRILSGKSCQFFVDAIPLGGVTELTYKEKMEAEYVYDDDRSGTPIGTTSGKYSMELSMTILRDTWQKFAPILALKGLGSISSANFTLTAKYSEPLAPLQTVVDVISFVRVTGIEDTYSEGISALVTKLDMMAIGMTRNGLPFFDIKRSLPL